MLKTFFQPEYSVPLSAFKALVDASIAGLMAVMTEGLFLCEKAGGQNEPSSHADTDTSFISYSYLPLINI